MILKIEEQYINIGEVDTEKKAKTLEDVLNSEGDLSYQFTIPLTNKLKTQLKIEKLWTDEFTQNIECDLLADNGEVLYPKGFLVIEAIERKEVEAYFQGGNFSAASILSGNLSDFDFFEDPIAISTTNIQASWDNDSGIVFPVIDCGLLEGRVNNSTFETEDFHPFIYVKTLVSKILSRRGIKLTGDILTDAVYNNMLFTSAGKDGTETQLNKRSVNAGKTTAQTTTSVLSPEKVTFTNITDNPYYNGDKSLYNTSNSRFTADTEMDVKVEVSLTLSLSALWTIEIYVNGAAYSAPYVEPRGTWNSLPAVAQGTSTAPYLAFGDETIYNQKIPIHLNAGDYIEVFLSSNTGDPTINSGYFKVTPTKFYTVIQESLLPNMTEAEFIFGIFAIFCPIIEFDPTTKTLEVNLFEKIKERTPIDFSPYISKVKRVDFTDVVSQYGRSTILAFGAGDSDEIDAYNERNKVCYGCGEIEVNNQNIQAEKTIDFGFDASYIKSNPLFGGQLLKYKFKEFEDFGDEVAIASVANSAGLAAFTTSSAHGLTTGKWVNITESTVAAYKGIGKVTVVDSDTFTISNLAYTANATGSLQRTLVNNLFSDGMYLTLHVPNVPIENVSSKTAGVYLNSTLYGDIGYTYFDKPFTGKDIDNLKKVLSFDQINTREFYGGITQNMTYFNLFGKVLNKPAKVIADANIPDSVYKTFKFKYPIRYNEDLFYVNNFLGYKGSHLPCEVELIKLP